MRRDAVAERQPPAHRIRSNRPSDFLSPAWQVYFRDVYDRALRIDDSLDACRDLLGNALDSNLTQVSDRRGEFTKGSSVVATLSIPFVVRIGMLGMNVSQIPLSNPPHAFWWMLGQQLGLGVILLVVLRLRRLL